MSKLKSRKLWLSIASLLGSVATAIAGFATDNQAIIMVGVICGVISTGIYTIAEALVDRSQVEDNYVEDDPPVREVLCYTYGADGTLTVSYTDGTSETFRRED